MNPKDIGWVNKGNVNEINNEIIIINFIQRIV